MSPGSNTESYPAFAHIGLRENPGKNLNQVTCPDRESNPGHLVSRPDALTVTPQVWTGKLTSQLHKQYLEKVIKTYVKEQPFLLILDSWEGQENPFLYDEIFTNEENEVTCSLKVISPKCTGLWQSCAVYFLDRLVEWKRRPYGLNSASENKTLLLTLELEEKQQLIIMCLQAALRHCISAGTGHGKTRKSLTLAWSCDMYNKYIFRIVILPVVLCGCETWTLTLREEQRLRVFENKVLRKIFGAKRDEVTGEWRKLHNAELHALYSSPNIIRNIKSRRLRWAGHVARMGESRNAYRVLVGRPEGKRPLGRPRRRWEDNIKMDLREVGYDGRDWINLAQDRDQWWAYVRAAKNLRVS
ncbi:hypothetical protein ANN_02335 [Periplaneta americana]|uniref:Uncharacterized protein n=1 Tax=Periplaneta americana TaxID=6978 RepID=A0ABQ8TYH0_PERAM|nr:hypothetical protein ANN_02335 [Periplaneta americana]